MSPFHKLHRQRRMRGTLATVVASLRPTCVRAVTRLISRVGGGKSSLLLAALLLFVAVAVIAALALEQRPPYLSPLRQRTESMLPPPGTNDPCNGAFYRLRCDRNFSAEPAPANTRKRSRVVTPRLMLADLLPAARSG